jgi:hypothetical protein
MFHRAFRFSLVVLFFFFFFFPYFNKKKKKKTANYTTIIKSEDNFFCEQIIRYIYSPRTFQKIDIQRLRAACI